MKIDSIIRTLNKRVDSIIVVDIGSKLTLLAVELEGTIRVNALKVIALSDGEKEKTIVDSLRDFIKDNKIQHKNAILRLDVPSLLIKRLELPVMPEKELKDALGWQLKEDISFDLNHAVLDFSIMKKTKKEDGSHVFDIMCAIAEAGEITPYVLLLKKAGLSCLSVGLLPFGYAKLIGKCAIAEQADSFGIVHLQHDCCFLVLFENKQLVFYRELPISEEKLKEALRTPLVSQKGTIKLSNAEINEMLYAVGVPAKEIVYKNLLSSSQIFSMLRPHLERLVEEVRRSLAYYESQLSGRKIQTILLAGAACRIPNLNTFIINELSLEVGNFSLLRDFAFASRIGHVDISDSYALIGLAFDLKRGFNLLPYEFHTETIEVVEKVSLRWVTIISLLLLAVFFFFARVEVGNYQKRLDNKLVLLNMLSQVKDIKAKSDALGSFVSNIKDVQPRLGTILKMLSSRSNERLFLTSLVFDCTVKSGTLEGFIKSGNKNPDVILAEFVRGMESSDFFSDATIASVERRERGGAERTHFVLKVTLL